MISAFLKKPSQSPIANVVIVHNMQTSTNRHLPSKYSNHFLKKINLAENFYLSGSYIPELFITYKGRYALMG